MRQQQLARATLAAGAALAVLAFSAAPASAKTKTATKTVCVTSGAAIPNVDHGFVRVPVSLGTLPKKAKIVDVNATLRATTPDVDDTHVYLASPSGKFAMLVDSQRTSSGTAFGAGAGCSGTPSTFDDEAATTLETATTPFTGSFRPFTPLSVMDGGPAAGSFSFLVMDLDSTGAPTQTVDAAGVTVTYSYPVKKKKKKKSKTSATTAGKFVTRTGSKDVCVPQSAFIGNNQPANDRASLNAFAIPTGKLPKGAKITDIDARLRMTHTYAGDIDIWLASQSGGIVPLWIGNSEDNPDGPGNPFGAGPTDCTGTPTVFDDEATTPITSVATPFLYAGSFKPITPLSGIDGLPAAGSWTMYVNDHYTTDQGTLHAVGLNIDYRYRAKKKAKK